MKRILALCTGNSARSQMVEGFLRAFDPELDVSSAGTQPAARVHPAAIHAMSEAGIDLSGHQPKSVDRYTGQPFDFVITVCDRANETCPVFTGGVGRRVHIGFEDPAAVRGTDAEVLEAFRRVRDEIRERLHSFYASEIAGATIRPATSEDRERAERLLATCALPPDGLADQFPGGYAVAEAGSVFTGLAGVEIYGPYGLLRSVAVAPGHRGRGIAARLVRDRIEWARTKNLSTLYLLTTTAAVYFPRAGFVRIARDEGPQEIRDCVQFTTACPGSSVLMKLDL
jgi:arsenate reductase